MLLARQKYVKPQNTVEILSERIILLESLKHYLTNQARAEKSFPQSNTTKKQQGGRRSEMRALELQVQHSKPSYTQPAMPHY